MSAWLPSEETRAEQMEASIPVLILETQRLVAESLRQALESLDPQLTIVGVATTSKEAATLAERERPQVMLVDSELAHEITADFSAGLPGKPAIVMLGDDDAEETLLTALQAEWRGYVDKQLPLKTLVGVIKRTAAGEVAMPADLLYRAIKQQSASSRNGNGARLDQLTVREREVLELIGHGLDNKSIAATLGIRLTTTRSHVQRVLEKLGVHSKLQAMRYAGSYGHNGKPLKRNGWRRR